MSGLSSWFSLRPEIVFGLYPRLLCFVFLVSFSSLLPQVVALGGARGAFPVALRLQKLRESFSPWRRAVHFPSLLWLNHSDAMLRALVCAGLVSAACGIYGGPVGSAGMLGCYVTYLSLDVAIGLIFPWDCLLFELAFLSLFLEPWHALPQITATAPPAPLLAWALRVAVFRIMFGFGKIKFAESTREDNAYLSGFLVNQPLPSKIGWYLQKAPIWALKAALVVMFITEIPVPLLVFHPDLGIVTALATAGLMVGIQACGNFGYFNLVGLVACVALLDVETPRRLELTHLFSASAGAPVLTNAVLCLHFFFALLSFPLNSWCAQHWHRWPFFLRWPRLLTFPIELCSFLHGLRWVHSYGVFPPHTSPGVRMAPIIEVSADGVQWREIEYPLACTRPKSPPRFISPHHARNDQAVIYETFGLNSQSLINGLTSPGDPCVYTHVSGAQMYMQRLLEGHYNPGILTKKGDFVPGEPPPRWARVRTFLLEPTSHEERVRTGAWWKRAYVGPHAAPTQRREGFWEAVLAEPELWHPEMVVWRRRSRIHEIVRRAERGEAWPSAILAGAEGLRASDVDAFWDELLPLARTFDRDDWSRIHEAKSTLDARYDPARLRTFERVLGRLCVYASARLDPLYLRRGSKPLLPVKNYGRLWLLIQDVIFDGRDAYEAMLAEPLSIRARAESMTLERGLFLLTLFRYDAMVFEAQKLRLLSSFTEGFRPAAFAEKERRMREKLASVSLFAEVVDFLRDKFVGAAYDGGSPERYPTYDLEPSGAIVLRESSVHEWDAAR